MQIKFFGTAAAEGVPALFCNCKICKNALKVGGKEVRFRTQTLIDDDLLIDFPPDSLYHKVKGGLDLNSIEHLIITHSHHDHFFAEDLMMRMKGYGNGLNNLLTVYGNKKVESFFYRAQDLEGFNDLDRIKFKRVNPYETFRIKNYNITPLVADHASNEDCYIYQIEKSNKQFLYGHDTGFFPDHVWEYWENNPPFFKVINLDCTHQKVKVKGNHMSIYDNLKIKSLMIEKGYADENTIFVLSHFSHNGGCTHDEMEKWGLEHGFTIAYDGLQIKV